MKTLKTLEKYLRDALKAGNMDHALRACVLLDGRVYFYIHPATASGDTQDYTAEYNTLTTHDGQPDIGRGLINENA